MSRPCSFTASEWFQAEQWLGRSLDHGDGCEHFAPAPEQWEFALGDVLPLQAPPAGAARTERSDGGPRRPAIHVG